MRHFTLPIWGFALVLSGTLVLPVTAGEVAALPAAGVGVADGELTSCHKHCYDPCEPVGPIRRFFRRVFLRPCPPPPPPLVVPRCPTVAVIPGPVPAAPVPYVTPPAPTVPAAPPAAFPSAEMGRPQPVPPTTSESSRPPEPADDSRLVPEPVPPTTGSAFPRLTPPLSEQPIRLDRIASTGGVQGQVLSPNWTPRAHTEVTLVSASHPGNRENLTADGNGRFVGRLPSGEWIIYTRTPDGRWAPQGRVQVREHETAKVTIVGD
jgi:hypothetical protein